MGLHRCTAQPKQLERMMLHSTCKLRTGCVRLHILEVNLLTIAFTLSESPIMILINTTSLTLHTFSQADQPYAILSHTWDSPDKEVTYQEMVATPRSDALMTKPGYRKIIKTCEVARDRYSLSWAWIDTCCIDKSSSADLSEAINSMFSWYKAAVVCIAYLSDFDGYNEPVIGCRWFTRGWTLQELIAPKELVFINNEWRLCGTKEARAQEISKGTGIPVSILKHEKHLDDVPVAARMSWASTRETTRIEDLAYCLLGISDVNMPILYGEGQKAFLRLQDAILSQNDDLSLFLWTDEESAEPYIGLFAHHPRCFKGKGRTESRPSIQQHDVSSTNRGIRLNSELATTPETNMALLSLKHSLGRDEPTMALCLRQVGMDMYVRVGPTSLSRVRRNADQTLINVAKVLTSAHSAAIAENRIHISLGTDLRIFGGRPHASWDPRARVFYAGYKGGFMGELKIRISKEDWFVLQCEFCNGQWAVGTLKKEQWDKFVKRTTWEYYDKTRDFAIGLNEDGTLIRHPGSSNTIIRAWVDEVQTSTAFVKITTEVTAP